MTTQPGPGPGYPPAVLEAEHILAASLALDPATATHEQLAELIGELQRATGLALDAHAAVHPGTPAGTPPGTTPGTPAGTPDSPYPGTPALPGTPGYNETGTGGDTGTRPHPGPGTPPGTRPGTGTPGYSGPGTPRPPGTPRGAPRPPGKPRGTALPDPLPGLLRRARDLDREHHAATGRPAPVRTLKTRLGIGQTRAQALRHALTSTPATHHPEANT